MDKHPAALYKGLIVAIIILFIGAIITPLVGSLSIQKSMVFGNTGNSGVSLITIKVDGEIVKDWYVSDVGFNFTYESDEISKILYKIDSGEWQNYSEPFYLSDDSREIWLEWCAVNNEGNYSDIDGPFICSIDRTGPDIGLTYEIVGGNMYQGWDFEFTATCKDAISGMERVEFYFNNELQETVYGPGPDFVWCLRYWPIPQAFFRATGYDNAGNSASDEIRSSTGKTCSLVSPMFDIVADSGFEDFEVSNSIGNCVPEDLSLTFSENEFFDPGYIILVQNLKRGKNGWLNGLSIPISYETDRIDEAYYQINLGEWIPYSEPLIFLDGYFVFSWYAVDLEGNQSTPESLSFKIDQTCPEIILNRERLSLRRVKFTANVNDETSGIDRVKFKSEFGGSFTDYDFPYEWIWTPDHWISCLGDTVTVSVFDKAGNSNASSKGIWINNHGFNQEGCEQSTTNSDFSSVIGNSNLEIINISVWEAFDLLTDIGNGIQIPIDIRIDEEWNESFIDTPFPEHPVHFSKAMLETPDGLAEFIETYEDKEIILYNNQNMGYSWLMYLYILEDAGYSGTIYVWNGGLQTWIDEGFPIRNNSAPEEPCIEGPHPRGRQPVIGFTKTYKFTTIDPDGDKIYLYIEWEDFVVDERVGPFDSGEEVKLNHTWDYMGTYTVRAYAEDIFGAVGPWGEEQIPIENNKRILLLMRMIDAFPLLEVLLRIINL